MQSSMNWDEAGTEACVLAGMLKLRKHMCVYYNVYVHVHKKDPQISIRKYVVMSWYCKICRTMHVQCLHLGMRMNIKAVTTSNITWLLSTTLHFVIEVTAQHRTRTGSPARFRITWSTAQTMRKLNSLNANVLQLERFIVHYGKFNIFVKEFLNELAAVRIWCAVFSWH